MVQPHPSGSGGAPSPRGRSTRSGPPSAINVGLVALAGLLLLGVATGGGRETLTQVFGFLVFYCGVFTLVSLTLTVIAGLVATDRIILVARHRVWVQSVHRTLGIVAISCLGLHIGTELVAGRVGIFGALLPFTTAPFTIGAGSVAAYLMVLVMWTGIVRSRFAQNGRPWLWRPLHAVAYLSWPVALWHGLNAGRPPAVWVTASYLVLAFLTTVALGLRLSAERNRRHQQLTADRTTTEIAPIGRPAPAGYERRTMRESRSASRFRWDAPAAEELWDDDEGPADRRADYRREPVVEAAPITAIPVTSVVYPDPEPYEAPAARHSYDPDPYVAEYYEPDPEPAPTFRGVAAPVYDDYDPYATYPEPAYAESEPVSEYRDEASGLTLRDRFAARRAAAAEVAEADRYADDDTPTLVNLDTRRELREERRARRAESAGRRRRADDVDDAEYWARLRGEAR
ncbi:hypothetical protein [Dactylosporangium sp. CA-139066]|uniref:hypothetical protein n=1 Tax=Dactylosporangium sp. CA-139066 TaxID=3239930 RepID=UPI003D8D53FF